MAEYLYKNCSIHYAIQGEGPALVLLHGFLEDLSMWDHIKASFLSEFTIVCIDLLGHGQTGSIGYCHSMEDQALMVQSLLLKLDVQQYIVIGHSMGGYVALALAELFPQSLQGLCLMNSTAFADSSEKKHNRDRAIEAVKHNHKNFIRIAIPGLFAPWNRKKFAKKISEITEISLQMTPQGIIAALEGMKIRKDRTTIFKNAPLDKMIIIGEKDPALDLDSLLYQADFEKVQSQVFKDGHMSHIENEKELITTFRNFLAGIHW